MINLALLYQDIGNYAESETIYKKAIELREKQLGKKHPDYAHMLNNLAALYAEMGNDPEVENLLLQSAEIYDKKLNKVYKRKLNRKHPSYANVLSNLGNFYKSKGRYGEAENLLKEARIIREQNFGIDNPICVTSREDLAILYWDQKKLSEARELYSEVMESSLGFIASYFTPLSESEKAKYWSKLRPRFNRFYAFAIDAHDQIPDITGDVFNYQLATKGLLLSVTTKVKKQILESNNQTLINDYLTWIDQKENLVSLYGYSKEELEEENINLDSLENEVNVLERKISSQSELFTRGYRIDNYTYQDIRRVLNEDEVMIEVIKVNRYTDESGENACYMVLILTSDQTGPPEMVIIENGDELENRYYNYYKNAIRQRIDDRYSYHQFWEKIDNEIHGKNNIFLSPDGIYNQINPYTIRNPDGTYLIEHKNIILVGNARDVISIKKTEKDNIREYPDKNAVLVGYPDYGHQGTITPLPGTRTEIQKISEILSEAEFQNDVFLEKAASEDNIKRVKNPKILHVATHGFFMENIKGKKEKVFGIELEKAREDPLLRSGLLLAQAENIVNLNNTNGHSNQNNGILTAYETMTLSLDETDIVVLSACETGLGEIRTGEGIYGLQRALIVSGSRSVIMSLWKVNDETTQQLMTEFYRLWLTSGNKKEAFKKAQLTIKSAFKDPFYWGAFVLIGD